MPDPLDVRAPDDAATTAIARARAGELLSARDLMAIFHLQPPGFYQRAKRGDFNRFLVQHPIGRRRYSGVLVARYLDGDPVYVSSFARRRVS
jgi:hypothetical protein